MGFLDPSCLHCPVCGTNSRIRDLFGLGGFLLQRNAGICPRGKVLFHLVVTRRWDELEVLGRRKSYYLKNLFYRVWPYNSVDRFIVIDLTGGNQGFLAGAPGLSSQLLPHPDWRDVLLLKLPPSCSLTMS